MKEILVSFLSFKHAKKSFQSIYEGLDDITKVNFVLFLKPCPKAQFLLSVIPKKNTFSGKSSKNCLGWK